LPCRYHPGVDWPGRSGKSGCGDLGANILIARENCGRRLGTSAIRPLRGGAWKITQVAIRYLGACSDCLDNKTNALVE
jgi:hypothetical protein